MDKLQDRYSIKGWYIELSSRNRLFSKLLVGMALLGSRSFFAEPAATQQQGAEPPAAALGVEKIYTRPGLAAPTLSGLEWSPDGRFLSYLRSSSDVADRQGGSAKTDIYAMDLTHPDMPPRILVDAAKLKELLPPSHQKNTQSTGLGRVTPEQYQWAPGSQALLFVSSDNLYWFDLQTQTGRGLLRPMDVSGADQVARRNAQGKNSTGISTEIKDARVSPDGTLVSFVRSHDLWVVEVATGRERQLTRGGSEELLHAELDWVYPEELEIRQAYWWSPDSSKIAFLQMDERPVTNYPLVNSLSYTGETQWMRYPKAGDPNPIVHVGVTRVPGAMAGPNSSGSRLRAPAESEVRWMDTGADTNVYLARVNWQRDSSALAIQRLNRAQNKLDLLIADATSGQSHVVLSEEDKDWINLSHDLYFFAEGKRFLWSSESDHVPGAQSPNPAGLRYLYVYDMSGKLLKQLTHGDTQTSRVAAVDDRQGAVFFIGTDKNIRERHLYRVSSETQVTEQITREPGTHNGDLSPTFDFFVDTFSTAEMPPQQRLTRIPRPRDAHATHAAGLVIGGGATPQLTAAALRPVEFFTVPASDGTPLQAMMIRPANFNAAKKHPVIVSLYGGPHGQLVVNSWGAATALFNRLLAQNGYISFTLDNRGSAGRGHAFETPLYHQFGGVELADQLAGVAWLKSQPFVDPTRIGVRGWSYGGFMTCMAMFRAADVFKAGFAGSPVTDWRQYDSIYTERYMGMPQENPEGYKNSSPVNFASQLKGKLLIAAGTGDDNVHFANTVELAEKLIDAGRYAEVQIYPGRGHGISDQNAQLHLFRHVLEFFLSNL